MKVVGIGLNKTGTKTLQHCLKHWGFKHTSVNFEAFKLWRNREYETLLELANEFDSFEDWPWALIYKEIDEAFPGTKFILTRRVDTDTWFKSLCAHAHRTGPTEYRKHIYGYEMPDDHKAHHIQFYERHNQSAREYFKNRTNDFLEVCWEIGDGWDQLAEFLGLERPNISFPHINKSGVVVDKMRRLRRHTFKILSHFFV